jgi:adenine phosphoribosyltransferase
MLDTKTVQDYIRTIPDFPHEGILFRDVTTLFLDPRGFRLAIDQLLAPFVGQEDRPGDGAGGAGLHPRRRGGASAVQGLRADPQEGQAAGRRRSSRTTTWNTAARRSRSMTTRCRPGHKILLVDDLLATGGTAEAGIKLIERLGGEVIGCAFVVDLPDLGGRKKLEDMGMSVHAICTYEGL